MDTLHYTTAEGNSYTTAPKRCLQKCNSAPLHFSSLLLCFLPVLFEVSTQNGKLGQPCAVCRAHRVPEAAERQPRLPGRFNSTGPLQKCQLFRRTLASLFTYFQFFLSHSSPLITDFSKRKKILCVCVCVCERWLTRV